MRPYVIGGACDRVRQQVDAAMIEGVLTLPPALAAHAERCPHCSAEVHEVETLLQRLRSLPASLDLSPVPAAVDRVLQAAAADLPSVAAGAAPGEARRRTPQWRWVLGQVAAVAAMLIVAAGGLTFLGLKIHDAVTGAEPSAIVERWVAPLREWTEALFRNAR